MPDPEEDAFVPISTVTTLPLATAPPSPAQIVNVTVWPEIPIDA